MRWKDKLQLRFRMLFLRKQAGEQLRDELHFHLEQQVAENIAAGMSPREARSAALRLFGNPEMLREQTHATWSWNWLELFLLDLRQSIRALLRARGFSAVVIVVLALGIGANVALFSVVHAVLLTSLPFPESGQLVRVFEADHHGRFQDSIVAGGSFAAWREHQKSFSALAIKRSVGYNLSGSNNQLPEFVHAQVASWNLFPLLGVQPALGRIFTASDDRPGAERTVVLTWGLWKRRYAGNPSILGKTIQLDARPFTVIGVLPSWFQYPDTKMQLWTAIYREKSPELMEMVEAHNFDVIGRLKPGVTEAQANTELTAIQAEIRRQHPDGPVNDATNLRPILDAEVRDVKPGLYALLAATGCLLLIACLNIASLFVARSAARQREMAVRTALGGSRLRLMRGTMIESLLLAAAGSLAGVGLAAAGLKWLVAVRTDIPRADEIHIDGWAMLFALGALFMCSLVAGLLPALAATDRHILRSLQANSRSQAGSMGRLRLRRVLLALEVGLTVVLLVGSGLLLKTYERLRAVDLGCATHNVLTMEISLPKGSYGSDVKRVAFAEALTQRLSAVQGIAATGLTSMLPAEGVGRDDVFTIREHPPLPQGQTLDAVTIFIDPGYVAATQIPLREGRLFRADERLDRAQSVLVNQALVRENFAGEDPLGKHIVSSASDEQRTYEIVGVVGDTRADIAAPARAAIYFPLYMGTERSLILTARTRTEAAGMALTVQKEIAAIDPDLPIANVLTMEQVIGQATLEPSFDAILLLTFAVLSLILAAVGLFGVLSFLVNQRTAEMGVRLALGAERNQIARLMLADGLRPALLGLVLGLSVSAFATRLIQSMLFGASPLDPIVMIVVSCALLMVAIAACIVPAWRASRLDPMQALRTE